MSRANPFLTPQGFLRSDQALATGKVVEVDDPDHGRCRQVGPIAHFLRLARRALGPAHPRLGAGGEEHGPPTQPAPAARPTRGFPLDDITIVECAFAYAAPFASTLLAEMGARVIKVEPPMGRSAPPELAHHLYQGVSRQGERDRRSENP